MGISEWTGVIMVCATIISSIVGLAFWAGKQNANLVKELGELKNEIVRVESKMALKVAEGPEWLQKVLDKHDELFETLRTSTDICLHRSEQHDKELGEIKTELSGMRNKIDYIHNHVKNGEK